MLLPLRHPACRCHPWLPRLQATFTLEEGLSWADIPVLLLWCEDYFADFGHVELQPGRDAGEQRVGGPPPKKSRNAGDGAQAPAPAHWPHPLLPSVAVGDKGSGDGDSESTAPPSDSNGGSEPLADGNADGGAAPAPPPPLRDAGGVGLANCVELLPGVFNLHWEVGGGRPLRAGRS